MLGECKVATNFLGQVEREIRKLAKEKDALDRRIKKLEAVRAEYMKDQPHDNSRNRVETETEGRVKKIISILLEAGKPMHYKDIVASLEKSGAEAFEGVKNRGNTITATMSLHKDLFKRVGKGLYTLAESDWFKEEPPEETKS